MYAILSYIEILFVALKVKFAPAKEVNNVVGDILLPVISSASPVLIKISAGSKRRLPTFPFAAVRSTVPLYPNKFLELTSAKPPSPKRLPPFAEIFPAKLVD